MSDNDDSTRPSPEYLKNLLGSLPSMAEGLIKKQIGGVTVKHPHRPMKVCSICGAGFDFQYSSSQALPEDGICPQHQSDLDQGYTIIKCPNKFMVIDAAGFMPGSVGQVFHISEESMDNIKMALDRKKRFQERKQKSNGHSTGENPT